jgi:hypothetical protein
MKGKISSNKIGRKKTFLWFYASITASCFITVIMPANRKLRKHFMKEFAVLLVPAQDDVERGNRNMLYEIYTRTYQINNSSGNKFSA